MYQATVPLCGSDWSKSSNIVLAVINMFIIRVILAVAFYVKFGRNCTFQKTNTNSEHENWMYKKKSLEYRTSYLDTSITATVKRHLIRHHNVCHSCVYTWGLISGMWAHWSIKCILCTLNKITVCNSNMDCVRRFAHTCKNILEGF